jgi:hypothetical protein
VRMLILVALFCAICSCKPVPGLSEQTDGALPTDAGGVQMEYYKRRIAKSGEVLAPPVLMRLSGTLEQKNDCLILKNSDGDHILFFEEGKVSFDPIRKVLTADSARIVVGDPISVGGPFNQPAESFDPSSAKKRCGVDAFWLVTGWDVRSYP